MRNEEEGTKLNECLQIYESELMYIMWILYSEMGNGKDKIGGGSLNLDFCVVRCCQTVDGIHNGVFFSAEGDGNTLISIILLQEANEVAVYQNEAEVRSLLPSEKFSFADLFSSRDKGFKSWFCSQRAQFWLTSIWIPVK